MCFLLFFVTVLITRKVYLMEKLESLWPDAAWCIFFNCFCALLSLIFVVESIWQFRKYRIAPDGISVSYFQHHVNHFHWSAVSEIGICKVHFNSRGGSETVFRFVIGHEVYGPSQGYGQWAYLRYSMAHRRRIIIVDYSPSLHSELESICPIQIHDYRHLPDR